MPYVLRSRTVTICGVLCLVVTLSACTGASQTIQTPVDAPAAFSQGGADPLPERWWTVFGDDGLTGAVDSALINNFDLRTAWERLVAARAVTDRQAAGLLPMLDATADGEQVWADDERETGGLLGVGFVATYEVDLWGRIRSSVDAERLRARATRADYQAAALSLAAEIARVWMGLAEAQAQVTLVDEQIQTNLTVLQLIENRFGLGQVRAVDILRQRQLVERTREQRTAAESRREVLEHQLAVLLGRSPQEGPGMAPEDLPALPPLPDPGVPLDLVQRRPDVQRAFLLVQAADRDVATAISSRFPRLRLSASATSASERVDGLFSNWVAAVGGGLLAPLFYGGELRAEVDRTRAVRRERLYAYGQAVLTAFREVEDALALERRQRERIALIEAQLTLADQTFEQLRVQYLNGTNDYLDVLTALDDVQALRRDLLSARLILVDHRIALYQALAGSFETDRDVTS